MEPSIDPGEFIRVAGGGRPPIIYVAHPVAPQPGEVLARCMKCGLERTYLPTDPVNLHTLCGCDAPVRSFDTPAEVVGFNLRCAMRWWRWFHLGLRDAVWTMPWYVNVTANGEADRDLIDLGLRDDCEIVKTCTALMLCGRRVSSGMRREAMASIEAGNPVFQVWSVVGEPPKCEPAAVPWRRWIPEEQP